MWEWDYDEVKSWQDDSFWEYETVYVEPRLRDWILANQDSNTVIY